jgi:hypothetical protein
VVVDTDTVTRRTHLHRLIDERLAVIGQPTLREIVIARRGDSWRTIAAHVTEITGIDTSAQVIWSWLHADPDVRAASST